VLDAAGAGFIRLNPAFSRSAACGKDIYPHRYKIKPEQIYCTNHGETP
jgi:hypothetical protein